MLQNGFFHFASIRDGTPKLQRGLTAEEPANEPRTWEVPERVYQANR